MSLSTHPSWELRELRTLVLREQVCYGIFFTTLVINWYIQNKWIMAGICIRFGYNFHTSVTVTNFFVSLFWDQLAEQPWKWRLAMAFLDCILLIIRHSASTLPCYNKKISNIFYVNKRKDIKQLLPLWFFKNDIVVLSTVDLSTFLLLGMTSELSSLMSRLNWSLLFFSLKLRVLLHFIYDH